METLFLARHAETEYNTRGLVNGDPTLRVGLTELGIQQARSLGEALTEEPLDLCVVTEFPRTRETAEVALEGRHVPRLVRRDLDDPRCGAFEGRPLEEYRAWVTGRGSRNPIPGGGESRLEIVERYVLGFTALLERPELRILAVLHSLPLAYLYGVLEGRDPTPRMEIVPYAEVRRLTRAEVGRGVERLRAWCRSPTW